MPLNHAKRPRHPRNPGQIDFVNQVQIDIVPYSKSLLHFTGSNGSTTFTDVYGKVWTPQGNAQISTAQFKFNGSSGLFDGTLDRITTPDHADFALSTGEFTFELFFRVGGGDASRRFLFGQSNNTGSLFSYGLELNTANKLLFSITTDGSTPTTILSATQFTDTNWHHVSINRIGNVLKLFVDGVQEGGDISFSGTVYDSASQFAIGGLGELTSITWFGNIDEFIFLKGLGYRLENFTVPTNEY